MQKSDRWTWVTLTFDHPLTSTEVDRLQRSTDAQAAVRVPPGVAQAHDRERKLAFDKSSDPEVGALLAVLAAAVPAGGRILETGTGAGMGLAWIAPGLGDREDVEVLSVELDAERAASVRAAGLAPGTSVLVGDALELIGSQGTFDLVFADTPSAKTTGLADILDALRPGGALLIDDIADATHPESYTRITTLRERLFGDPRLVVAELTCSTGMFLATRRRTQD
ncbi:O-methyltransferase [Streptomyces sp. NRRL S-920]|uniref:O-methyltransferase n=1 Tax=Streptomyces sp. NRRL S-920 TaxID=1463921 RepID=UPI00068A6364|nr:class I SAM-dependent methyltransferase [Streptomyces sp. NRRL S-920]